MLDSIRIRLARPDDADELAAFNIALACQTERKELAADTVRRGVGRLLSQPQYGFYVVAETDAGRLAGCLLVTYEWSDWRDGVFWWIQSVFVRPEHRRRGVFGRMFAHVKDLAGRDRDVCGLRLYVARTNHTARAGYEKAGLKETGYLMYEQEFDRAP
ncbi:MAG: GNAT family N-acetyltransferase [Sedimentisphaerales bacterium]|nr:GNAT family N-acetyltransferase [Sedimentisphaerales bacterium]